MWLGRAELRSMRAGNCTCRRLKDGTRHLGSSRIARLAIFSFLTSLSHTARADQQLATRSTGAEADSRPATDAFAPSFSM